MHVPGFEDLFPEAVRAPRGHVAQVERGRAVAADRSGDAHHAVEGAQPLLEALVQVVGKAGDQQAVDQAPRARDAQRPAVQVRPLAALGGEELVAQRIEDRPRDDLAVHRERHRGAEEGVAVGEVHGAVERVDEPHMARAGAAEVRLLGDDVVLRVTLADRLEDRELAGTVDLGDEVDLALELDRDSARVALALQAAGLHDGFARHRQVPPAHRKPPPRKGRL